MILYDKYETLQVSFAAEYILLVALNRPHVVNAMNRVFWKEFLSLFQDISNDPDVRVVIIYGAGKNFSAGIDLSPEEQPLESLAEEPSEDSDVGRNSFKIQKIITTMQMAFTAITKCPQPVIAAIHGACIGGAIDLISACDIRYCSDCAAFSVKEVAVGLCADMGTLQRLPRIVGSQSWVRELCFTGRTVDSNEALSFGLVSKISINGRDGVVSLALETATTIAEHSPLAVAGTKNSLEWSQNHSNEIAMTGAAYSASEVAEETDTINPVLSEGEMTEAIFEHATLLRASLPLRSRVVSHPKTSKSKTISGCWKYFCCLAYDPELPNDKHVMCIVKMFDSSGKLKICGELLAKMSNNSTSNYLRHLDKAHPTESLDVRSKSSHSKEWKLRKKEAAALEPDSAELNEIICERERRKSINKVNAAQIEAVQNVFVGTRAV